MHEVESVLDRMRYANLVLTSVIRFKPIMMSERDELSDEAYDRYLGAELQLDRGEEVLSGTVKRRRLGICGPC